MLKMQNIQWNLDLTKIHARGWGNCYIKGSLYLGYVSINILLTCWAEKYGSLYGGLHYIEVSLRTVPLNTHVYDYGEKVDLSKGYWNSKRKCGNQAFFRDN